MNTIAAKRYFRVGLSALFLIYGGMTGFYSTAFSSHPPSLNKIKISGPSEVDENSTAYFSCKAYYDDGSSEDITGSASWSEECWYAQISGGGRLTTSVITRDETCRISAAYEEMQDSLLITIKNSAKALVRLEVEGPGEVKENESAYFKCWAYFDDGSWENVSDAVDWSEDSWFADVSRGGLVSTGEVEEDRWFQLFARYRGRESSLHIKIINKSSTGFFDSRL